jgi:protein SCO1/2
MAPPRSAFALRILGVGLTILAVGLTAWLLTRPEPADNRPATASGEVLIGGPFELVDQHGQTRRNSDFRGRHMLIYFGYTYCPDICPTSLMAMTQALDTLGRSDSRLAEHADLLRLHLLPRHLPDLAHGHDPGAR